MSIGKDKRTTKTINLLQLHVCHFCEHLGFSTCIIWDNFSTAAWLLCLVIVEELVLYNNSIFNISGMMGMMELVILIFLP